ncbi:hypothetical protein K435DRAFT_666956, partial [Dendrothele bispora CBS 962.96]
TKRLSKSNCPLVVEVLPYIDSLTKKLQSVMNNPLKAPLVHAAASRGYTVLNKYYGLTDDSVMYHMSMSRFISC